MINKKTKEKQNIKVISRAAGILRCLAQNPNGQSLGQISHKTKLPRSTVQRIVSSLVMEDLVATEGRYGTIILGPEIYNLAAARQKDLKNRLGEVMKRISTETGETVDLAIFTEDKMLFVDQVIGTQRLRTVSNIGESFPMTTTANGKAALACMQSDKALELMMKEAHTAVDPNRFLSEKRSEIEDISQGGLATDENEHTDGISALGFAVEDINGGIFAVSVPVPSTRYEKINTDLAGIIQKCRSDILGLQSRSV